MKDKKKEYSIVNMHIDAEIYKRVKLHALIRNISIKAYITRALLHALKNEIIEDK